MHVLLDKANNDKGNAAIKQVAAVATEAFKEIAGEYSSILKNVTKAADIRAPETSVQTALLYN